MDPVSVQLLLALAAGAAGAAGRQTWTGLTELVRRPFRRQGQPEAAQVASGEAELARLEESPGDPERAHALSTALAVRAALEPGFREALAAWHEEAKAAVDARDAVHNVISGGVQHGPVLMGRDFTQTTFTTAAQPPGAVRSEPVPPGDAGRGDGGSPG